MYTTTSEGVLVLEELANGFTVDRTIDFSLFHDVPRDPVTSEHNNSVVDGEEGAP